MLRKYKNDDMLREARHVLLNHVELDEDGHFVVVEEFRFQTWGAADGEHKIRWLGITQRRNIYNTDKNHTKAVYGAGKAMANIGRGINLKSNEDAVACIFRMHIFYPVVLIFFENDDDELCLMEYTARSVTAALACRFARLKFERSYDGLVRVEDNRTFKEKLADKKKEKDVRKLHKKDEKLKKKEKKLRKKEEKRSGEIEKLKKRIEDSGSVWNGKEWVPKEELEYDDDFFDNHMDDDDDKKKKESKPEKTDKGDKTDKTDTVSKKN